jgi:hypothetical protein
MVMYVDVLFIIPSLFRLLDLFTRLVASSLREVSPIPSDEISKSHTPEIPLQRSAKQAKSETLTMELLADPVNKEHGSLYAHKATVRKH